MIATGQVAFPEETTTIQAPSLYWSVLLDWINNFNMSFLILTWDRTSLESSSNLRKAAKASKQITAERILYKEAIESALQATNCCNWETVIGSSLDVWLASKRWAPARILFTNGWSPGDGSPPNWWNQAMLWTTHSRGDAVFALVIKWRKWIAKWNGEARKTVKPCSRAQELHLF